MQDDRASKLAAAAIARGRPLDWFEELYASADEGEPPWAHHEPNPNLIVWLQRERVSGQGRRALTVGCGLGDDAEELARAGFTVTAFDIAPSAIAMAQKRFPESPVRYVAADLLSPPPEWDGAFDFVFESYTLQAMPEPLRRIAYQRVASFVAPGGELLLIARARDEDQPVDGPPWPLAKSEIRSLSNYGLTELRIEDYLDAEEPPVRRFRARFSRLAAV